MILTFTTGAFTLWLLTVTMLILWYGLLVGVAAVAITLALILYGIAWLVTCAAGIFSPRRREGRFG